MVFTELLLMGCQDASGQEVNAVCLQQNGLFAVN